MYVVGIAGGIGSGKSTVTHHFSSLGIEIVDSDDIAREVVSLGMPALETIKNRFGSSILLADGNLNRSKLREIVFNSTSELEWLQSITHPEIKKITVQRLNSANSPYAILSSPLLIESGQFNNVNRVCIVDIPEQLQLDRTLRRDSSSKETVEKIIRSQISRQQRLARADDVIDNSGTLADTLVQIENLHKLYMKLAEEFS